MNTTPSKNSRHIYGVLLTGLADTLLIILLLLTRSARIHGEDVPFFSAEFGALTAGAMTLIGLSTWVVYTGRIQQLFTHSNRAPWWVLFAIWIIVTYAVVVVLTNITTVIQPYAAPFFIWLTFFNVGVGASLMFTGQRSETTGKSIISPLWKWLKIIAMVVLSIAVMLVLLEIILRVYFGAFGTEREKALYLYSAEQIVQEQGLYTGSPYINYGLSPSHPEHNSLGYRGAEITVPKPAGVFRIVALGGSSTYGVGIKIQDTYPMQLSHILRNEYGYNNVEVINGGVMSYSTWDTLANFNYHVLDIEPDMVIVYHAVNDVYARLVDPAHYNGLNPARGVWDASDRQLNPSALYRFLSINLRWQADPTTLEWVLPTPSDVERCQDTIFCDNIGMTPGEVLEANPPVYFERNLRNLAASAQAHGVQVVFSSWAYFPDEVNERAYMTYEHMQQGVGDHNAITARLAEELDLPYYDLTENIPYNPDFWIDGMHFTEAGAAEQARQYAAFLVENDLLPESDNDD